MKKIITATLLLASTSIFATESIETKNWFVGVDLVNYNNTLDGQAKVNGTTYSGSSSDSYTGWNIKFGKINKDNRQYGSYSVTYMDDEPAYNLFYESLDYNYELFGDEIATGLRPFYGGHIGLGFLTFETNNYKTTESGLEYGIQGGLLKQINNNSTIEIGAKYKLGTAEISATSGSDYASMKAKSATALYLGFNYSF